MDVVIYNYATLWLLIIPDVYNIETMNVWCVIAIVLDASPLYNLYYMRAIYCVDGSVSRKNILITRH